MTGRRRTRSKADKATGKSSTRAARKAAPEATHLTDKAGNLHKNVSVFEPTHGPNMADRMDTVDEHATETLPMKENAVPANRRIDEGQNRGAE